MRKYYQCKCGTQVIQLEKDKDFICEQDGKKIYDISIYFAIFFYGCQNHKYSLKELLRYFREIIKNGSPYSDNIILSIEDARKMGQDLLEMTKEENEDNINKT